MSIHVIVAIAAIVGTAIAMAAFYRPDRVLMRSAIAALCAVALPYVASYAVGPFLGEGAGFGVALILYVLSGAILLVAISAALGAATRYIWTAVRGRGA